MSRDSGSRFRLSYSFLRLSPLGMHAQEPGENQGIYGCAARRRQQRKALDPRGFPDCRRPIPGEDARMDDADLAASAAELAGKILLDLAQTALWTGAARGRVAELISNELILAAIRAHRPGEAILSEESVDDPDRLRQPRVWIVDPLDGTHEYAEGRGDWAVQVALAIRGKPAVGAIALPARGLLLRSDVPPALPWAKDRLRLLVSRTRPPVQTATLAKLLKAEIVPMGSAGAKVAALLLGDGEIYLHSGGQHEWDNCAPVAVALAAGLDATRLDGKPLVYNGADAQQPDLVVSHPAVTQELRDALDRLAGAMPARSSVQGAS